MSRRPPIDEDAQLLKVMGVDPEQWASSYLRVSYCSQGDALLSLTANWFQAAMLAGRGGFLTQPEEARDDHA